MQVKAIVIVRSQGGGGVLVWRDGGMEVWFFRVQQFNLSGDMFGHPGGGGVVGLEGGWRGDIAVLVFHVQGVTCRGGRRANLHRLWVWWV